MVGELPRLFMSVHRPRVRVCVGGGRKEGGREGERKSGGGDRKWVALEMLNLWEQSFDCDHLAGTTRRQFAVVDSSFTNPTLHIDGSLS